MRKLKYVKLFEAYSNGGLDICDSPNGKVILSLSHKREYHESGEDKIVFGDRAKRRGTSGAQVQIEKDRKVGDKMMNIATILAKKVSNLPDLFKKNIENGLSKVTLETIFDVKTGKPVLYRFYRHSFEGDNAAFKFEDFSNKQLIDYYDGWFSPRILGEQVPNTQGYISEKDFKSFCLNGEPYEDGTSVVLFSDSGLKVAMKKVLGLKFI